MTAFRADVKRLRTLADTVRSASRTGGPLDTTVSELDGVSKALESNGSLGTLGYGKMCSEVHELMGRQVALLGTYADGLDILADLAEHYENEVLALIGVAPTDANGEAFVDDEQVDAAIWATDVGVAGAVAAGEASEAMGDDASSGFWDFLTGKMEASDAVASYKKERSAEIGGVDIGAAVEGDLLGGSASFKPDGKFSLKEGEAYVGVEAKAEGHVAAGKVSADIGYYHEELEGKVLTGAVEGTAHVGLFSKGKFDPSLEVKGKAEASVLEGKASARFGSENYNVHAEATGKVLTASAEAGAKISKNGVEVSAGAEAYLASGEVKGGFTVLGVKVDATAKGHAGGAGVSVGGGINTDKRTIKFKAGAGLLVGAGADIEVDYSGAADAIDDAVDTVSEWWDSW